MCCNHVVMGHCGLGLGGQARLVEKYIKKWEEFQAWVTMIWRVVCLPIPSFFSPLSADS